MSGAAHQDTAPEGRSFSLKVEEAGGGFSVALAGPLTVDVPASAWASFPLKPEGQKVEVRLEALNALDLNGAAQLFSLRSQAEANGLKLELSGLPQDLKPIFDLAEEALKNKPAPLPPGIGFFEELGRAVNDIRRDAVLLTSFSGELLVEFFRFLRQPRSIRWPNVMAVAETAGANSVPIVSLVSFLVGLIIAFQAAMVLKMFGAEIYVADMVGVSVIRELGPLIAAIVLAGRSGSAFSAELGAMKAAEEVDAISTMGLSPVKELALPRVLASLMTTPFVTMIACFAGVLGGSLVLLAMGYSMKIYWTEAVSMVSAATFYICVSKSFLFGFTVAAVGCQRGLAAGDGPGAVGQATTSGVVTNIVMIAVLDSLLAVLFYVYDI